MGFDATLLSVGVESSGAEKAVDNLARLEQQAGKTEDSIDSLFAKSREAANAMARIAAAPLPPSNKALDEDETVDKLADSYRRLQQANEDWLASQALAVVSLGKSRGEVLALEAVQRHLSDAQMEQLQQIIRVRDEYDMYTASVKQAADAAARAVQTANELGQAHQQSTGFVAGFTNAIKQSSVAMIASGAAIGSMLGTFIVQAVEAAWRAIKNFVYGSIEAFAAMQEALVRVDIMLKIVGDSAGITVTHVERLAESMQTMTRFDSTDIERASAGMLKFGITSVQEFDRAMSVAADLATVMGSDIVSAAEMVGRAMENSYGTMMLRRTGMLTDAQVAYLRALKEVGTEEQYRSEMLRLLEQRARDASHNVSGLTGAWVQFKNEMHSAAESIGGALSDILRLEDALRHWVAILRELREAGFGAMMSQWRIEYQRTLADMQTWLAETVRTIPVIGKAWATALETLAERRRKMADEAEEQLRLEVSRAKSQSGGEMVGPPTEAAARATATADARKRETDALNEQTAAMEKEQRVIKVLNDALDSSLPIWEQQARASSEFYSALDRGDAKVVEAVNAYKQLYGEVEGVRLAEKAFVESKVKGVDILKQSIEALESERSAGQKNLEQLREQLAEVGKSKEQVALLRAEREKEKQVALESTIAGLEAVETWATADENAWVLSGKQLEHIRDEIAKRKELLAQSKETQKVQGDISAAEANAKAVDDNAKAWERLLEAIKRAGEQAVRTLDEQIEKHRQLNRELGMTPAEKAEAELAREQQTLADLQRMSNDVQQVMRTQMVINVDSSQLFKAHSLFDDIGKEITALSSTPVKLRVDTTGAAGDIKRIIGTIDAASMKYGLDPRYLRAIAQQESGFNPNAIGPAVRTRSGDVAHAEGLFQYMPATSSALGINPFDIRQASDAAGRDFANALVRYSGDVAKAIMSHFGGTDQSQWGPKTQQYKRDVMQKVVLQTDDRQLLEANDTLRETIRLEQQAAEPVELTVDATQARGAVKVFDDLTVTASQGAQFAVNVGLHGVEQFDALAQQIEHGGEYDLALKLLNEGALDDLLGQVGTGADFALRMQVDDRAVRAVPELVESVYVEASSKLSEPIEMFIDKRPATEALAELEALRKPAIGSDVAMRILVDSTQVHEGENAVIGLRKAVADLPEHPAMQIIGDMEASRSDLEKLRVAYEGLMKQVGGGVPMTTELATAFVALKVKIDATAKSQAQWIEQLREDIGVAAIRALDDLVQQNVKHTQEQIESVREHNREIGQTKEQIADLKLIEFDRYTGVLQGELESAQAMENRINISEREAEQAHRLVDDLREQLRLRRELRSEMVRTPVLEAGAESDRAYQSLMRQAEATELQARAVGHSRVAMDEYRLSLAKMVVEQEKANAETATMFGGLDDQFQATVRVAGAQKNLTAVYANVAADVRKQTAENREYSRTVGLTKEQVDALRIAETDETVAKLDSTIATKEREQAGKALDPALQDEIKRLKILRDAYADLGAAQRERATADAAAEFNRTWASAFTDVERRAEDFLIDFVHNGSSAFKNLWDDFINWALRAFARLMMQQLIINIAPSFGMGQAAQMAFGGGRGGLGFGSPGTNWFTQSPTGPSGMWNFVTGGGWASPAAYAAAVPGLTTFGAGSQAALLAAQTAEFGYAGTAMTASAGGAGSLATALGPLAPMLPAALIALPMIAGLFGDKEPSKVRGQFAIRPAGTTTGWEDSAYYQSHYGWMGFLDSATQQFSGEAGKAFSAIISGGLDVFETRFSKEQKEHLAGVLQGMTFPSMEGEYTTQDFIQKYGASVAKPVFAAAFDEIDSALAGAMRAFSSDNVDDIVNYTNTLLLIYDATKDLTEADHVLVDAMLDGTQAAADLALSYAAVYAATEKLTEADRARVNAMLDGTQASADLAAAFAKTYGVIEDIEQRQTRTRPADRQPGAPYMSDYTRLQHPEMTFEEEKPNIQLDVLRAVGTSAMDTFFDAGRGLRDLLDTFKGTAAETEALTTATQAYYAAEVQLLAQIEQVKQSVNDMFTDTIRSMRLQTMTDQEKYNFYQEEAAQLYEQMQHETDPVKIQRLAEKINADINAAFGLLSPAQQREMLGTFTDRVNVVNQFVQDHLGDISETIQTAAVDMFSDVHAKLDKVADKLIGAANTMSDAAGTQQDAANTPLTVDVNVTSDTTTVTVTEGEVGGES